MKNLIIKATAFVAWMIFLSNTAAHALEHQDAGAVRVDYSGDFLLKVGGRIRDRNEEST